MSGSRGSRFALSRSNPFFCSDFFRGEGGREKVGSALAKRGFGEGRTVQSTAAAPSGAVEGGSAPTRVSIGTPLRRGDSPAAGRRGLSKILISDHLTPRFGEGPQARARTPACSPARPA
ncbi:unnamed protein product [Pipistrellus nathusii]|uniref:Uncharacterized protein n=1 Tax=Pipistrellus nathusii TaxID=59473 RepID=A0ABP0A802_PIPNA